MTEPTDAKPVAWLVPKLHTFKGAERVHFTRAPGCTMTDAELTDYMEGRVMWLPTTFCDSDAGVTDKFGVVHKPKPLYTTPQPTQAQAGAVPMYRLLQSGMDRIEADDEFLSDDATAWAIDPNGIFVGNIYGGHVLRPARRRIKGGQHGESV